MTAAAGTAREMTVDTVKQGTNAIGTKIGKLTGAGLAIAGTRVVEVAGYNAPSYLAVGAAIAGMQAGGFVSKLLGKAVDKAAAQHGGGGGPVGVIMDQLSISLHTLMEVNTAIVEVTDTMKLALGHYRRVSTGATSLVPLQLARNCRAVIELLGDSGKDVQHARKDIGEHLVVVAATR